MGEEELSDQKEVNQPSTERVANLLFFSFKFSQGSFRSGLQNLILEYIRELHPEWRFNQEQKNAIKQLLGQKVNKYFQVDPDTASPHKKVSQYHTTHQYGNGFKPNPAEPIDSALIGINVDSVAGSFFSRTTDDHKQWYPHEKLVGILASGVIQRDHMFLVPVGGRPRSGKQNPHSHEKFQSQTMHFAIEGNSTSILEYDQMFSEIGECIKSGNISDENKKDLLKIKETVSAYTI